ncbi:MAG: hydrolase [Chthonomonadaceae bacterium]|nr:hydrolase [Chthonomonadaceae bacterium]
MSGDATTTVTPTIRGVLFDLDGTLGNTLPVCIGAFRRAIEPFAGREISDAEIVATFGPSEEGTVHVLAPGHAAEALAAYLHHYALLHDSCTEPFPGITEMLTDLQARGVKLALVTGKGQGSADISLERLSLAPFFEHIEVGSPLGPRKSEAITEILGRWDMEPASAIYVGDAPSDIPSARRAGTYAVAAAWAATAEPDLLRAENPDALFLTLAEFEAWLLPRLV